MLFSYLVMRHVNYIFLCSLFLTLWHLGLADCIETAPPRISQFLRDNKCQPTFDIRTNQFQVPSLLSSIRLLQPRHCPSSLNHPRRVLDIKGPPSSSDLAKIIPTSQSYTCSPCPPCLARSFLQKQQQRLSFTFSLSPALTDLVIPSPRGLARCGVPTPLGTGSSRLSFQQQSCLIQFLSHIGSPTNAKTNQKNLQKPGRKGIELFDTCLGLFSYQLTVYYIFPCPMNQECVGSHEIDFSKRLMLQNCCFFTVAIIIDTDFVLLHGRNIISQNPT